MNNNDSEISHHVKQKTITNYLKVAANDIDVNGASAALGDSALGLKYNRPTLNEREMHEHTRSFVGTSVELGIVARAKVKFRAKCPGCPGCQ